MASLASLADSPHSSAALDDLAPVLDPVVDRFVSAGHRLYLVGGIVRDLTLGVPSGFDIDCTTDADPATIKGLLSPLADAVWTQGERFGTIGATVAGRDMEITTHRAESYDPESRKPVVTFGDQLEQDLVRRDFTINAMAIELPARTLHDPYNGAADLERRVLRTPLSPEVSFTDDPLRMLRAARFISRFALTVADDMTKAATRLSERLAIVSVERVADEIERLLAVADPTAGLAFLNSTGLLGQVLGPLSTDEATLACQLAAEPAELLVRRAGLVWSTDVDGLLRRLRYSNDDRKATTALVSSVRSWIDERRTSEADARRLLAAAGSADDVLGLANGLIKHHPDEGAVASAQQLVDVVGQLAETDDLGPYESPLSAAEIIAVLEVEPGPVIGRAQSFLRSQRLAVGPLSVEQARSLLADWASQHVDSDD